MEEMKMQQDTVTRDVLAKAIKREVGITVKDSLSIVDDVIDIIKQSVIMEKDVKIRMFGSFSTYSKNERIGRNPRTMVEAVIPSRKVVKFRVAPTLKNYVNLNVHNV